MTQSGPESGDDSQDATRTERWEQIHEDLRGIERLMSIQLNLLRNLRERLESVRR